MPVVIGNMQLHILFNRSSGSLSPTSTVGLFPFEILGIDFLVSLNQHARNGAKGLLNMHCSLSTGLNILDFPMPLDKPLYLLR